MKKIKLVTLMATAILGISAFAPLAEPAQEAHAAAWQTKYSDGFYKVKIKKTTRVDRIKKGKASYLNKVSGHYTLHKGSVVKITYYGRSSYAFIVKSPHKYKFTSKYGYSANFKKGSFTVLKHIK